MTGEPGTVWGALVMIGVFLAGWGLVSVVARMDREMRGKGPDDAQ